MFGAQNRLQAGVDTVDEMAQEDRALKAVELELRGLEAGEVGHHPATLSSVHVHLEDLDLRLFPPGPEWVVQIERSLAPNTSRLGLDAAVTL